VPDERVGLFRRGRPAGKIPVTAGRSGLAWGRSWGRERQPPDPGTLAIRSLLLASEGRPIPHAAIDFAARIAGTSGVSVHVLSIARVWGTSFGLPNPGLLPSKREWDEQRRLVAEAVASLQRRGIQATGQVLGTRGAAKRIVAEAARHRCDAIVMAADPPRHWLIANLLWSHEPYRVRRLAGIPVYLIVDAQK
jgi:nucleotide-binding universal stress UspA family protein